MTDGGKFIGIIGILAVGLCVVGAAYFYVLELMARSTLPVEMQTAEMIQRYYDGEVVLFSITIATALICFAVILTGFFSVCFGICESVSVLRIEKGRRDV